jgi:Right handed beta helix region
VIAFTGVCAGPILIDTDGITLEGVAPATIDGGGQDAVIIRGASRVSLTGLEVRNGRSGILAVNGAHLALSAVKVHDNLAFGISIQTGSSALLDNVTTAQNGLHGFDLQTGSSATVSGTLDATDNRVFGINVNGSAITFTQATVSATGNALGIQIATGANAFINDSQSVVNASNNLSTG